MNVLGSLKPAAAAPQDYVSVAMKNIRALQKQYQDVGKRYQDEIAHPHMSGEAEQQLLRDMAHEMSSIKEQIDALEHAVVERQALDMIKAQEHKSDIRRLSAVSKPQDVAPDGTKSNDPALDAAKSSATDAAPTEGTLNTKPVDPTSAVGSIIDTTA